MQRHTPSRPTRSLRRPRGFTLIEMLMVVCLISILSALAYPSYRDYIIRGALTDATNGLSTMRAQMERHFLDNRSYATVGDFVSPCLRPNAAARTFGKFVVSCVGNPTATTFTLQAVGSENVDGFAFTVDQNDVRATTGAAYGWPTCASSWMTKKGQPC